MCVFRKHRCWASSSGKAVPESHLIPGGLLLQVSKARFSDLMLYQFTWLTPLMAADHDEADSWTLAAPSQRQAACVGKLRLYFCLIEVNQGYSSVTSFPVCFCHKPCNSLSCVTYMLAAELPWWDDNCKSESSLCSGIASMSGRASQSPHLPAYAKQAAILAVHSGNSHEGPVPQGYTESKNFELLEDLWDKTSSLKPANNVWYEKGGRTQSEGRAQLVQHMKALKYLCIDTIEVPL